MFYLNSTLNFGIPLVVLVFQLEVYYKVDRLLTGLTTQQKGTTARWYSNKTSLTIKNKTNLNLCHPNVSLFLKRKHISIQNGTLLLTLNFYSCVQWAAVRTHSKLRRVPPQNHWELKESPTIQGYEWGDTSCPPTILEVMFATPQPGSPLNGTA